MGIHFLYGQNLVKNPSFEHYKNCPKQLGNLKHDLIDWDTPTLGSTDYFHGCSQAMGTPKNFNGEQPADFGEGYVGLYLYAPDDYREYLQASLTETLKKGDKYVLSFYVSLAERSDFAIKEFGILFSEDSLNVETNKVLSRMHLSRLPGNVSNTFEISYSDFYSDNKEWVRVEKEFIANGTENFLVIGNFKDNKRTQKFKTKRRATKGSYYYLDMVSVISLKNNGRQTNPNDKVLDENYTMNETITFKSVLFNFDEFTLSTQSIKELDQMVTYLSSRPDLIISISGHTDSIGNKTYNLDLSRKRAKAVAAYLMQRGIDKKRISYQGFGSSKPLEANNTIGGRLNNRRVEFTLTKKF
ncbi:flagellar motor protein MotB [Maribacter cobaltidurans]|uniref:Flagellar motor protein MotB n=2 Tax=Maribacter cobaltidurans TaxID=1178778 RepID=A0A223V1M3_9FLAO|nr:flagellar motor protein MotB [Maribacter cobaltidurans]GGD70529.1 hypothetical protein GCM10011412_05160 [Maribacter cobaltidurans]